MTTTTEVARCIIPAPGPLSGIPSRLDAARGLAQEQFATMGEMVGEMRFVWSGPARDRKDDLGEFGETLAEKDMWIYTWEADLIRHQ